MSTFPLLRYSLRLHASQPMSPTRRERIVAGKEGVHVPFPCGFCHIILPFSFSSVMHAARFPCIAGVIGGAVVVGVRPAPRSR